MCSTNFIFGLFSFLIFHVVDGQENIRFIPASTLYERSEGTPLAAITCAADCNPPCGFSWNKSGSTISTTSILNVGILSYTDAGTYTCTAAGSQGDTLSKALTVYVISGPNNMFMSPPEITYTQDEFSTLAIITCGSQCWPCSYNWSGPNSFTSTNEYLDLGTLSRSEHGTYTCTSRNTRTSDTETTSVTVAVRASPRPSEYVELVPNITRSLHDSGSLSMTVSAYPQPSIFVWSKLSKRTTWTKLSSDEYINISTDGLRSDLIITNIQETHFGQYKIDVDNGIGVTFSQIFFIKQQERPDASTDLQPLHETVTESTITVQWKPGFNGGLQQTFYIEYRKSSDTHWSVEAVSEPAINITLNGLESGTKYVVQIYSQNAIGKSTITDLKTFVTLAMVIIQVELLIGAFVGGIFMTIVVLVIVVLLLRRYNKFACMCYKVKTTEQDNITTTTSTHQHENINGEYSNDEREQGMILETAKGDAEASYESTVPVNLKEHVYSDLHNVSPEYGTELLDSKKIYLNLCLDK